MKFIINADDYGLGENPTRAIVECFDRGFLAETTMVVNTELLEECLDIATDHGFVDKIGLHVNLTEGRPLTDKIRRSHFCDANGNFSNWLYGHKLNRFYLSREDIALAAEEIQAQMRKFRELGLKLRHTDSHRYIGTYFPLTEAYLRSAREFGFLTTRAYMNTCRGSGRKMSMAWRIFLHEIERRYNKSQLSRADYVGFFRDIPRIEKLCPENSIVELHCHPNYRLPDGTLSMQGALYDGPMTYDESYAFLVKSGIMKVKTDFGSAFARH